MQSIILIKYTVLTPTYFIFPNLLQSMSIKTNNKLPVIYRKLYPSLDKSDGIKDDIVIIKYYYYTGNSRKILTEGKIKWKPQGGEYIQRYPAGPK